LRNGAIEPQAPETNREVDCDAIDQIHPRPGLPERWRFSLVAPVTNDDEQVKSTLQDTWENVFPP
jgi:hypothetical protein